MALEWGARPAATGTGGTGAASTLEQPQCLSHTAVLTFHPNRVDWLAATLLRKLVHEGFVQAGEGGSA